MTSRNIPSDVKRKVRQRCGFGCVVCGLPLYEYDHMNEWASSKTHKADEITLLCDKHHKEVTNGFLTREMVLKSNRNPINKQNQITSPWRLHFNGNKSIIDIGSCSFKFESLDSGRVFFPLVIDNFPVIMVKFIEGEIFLNICILDEDKRPIFKIIDNELDYSTDNWDVELIGRELTIREGKGKFIFQIEFNPPTNINIKRAELNYNNSKVSISNKELKINQNTFSNCSVVNFIGGIVIGRSSIPSIAIAVHN